jgi:hypothetical protein
MRGSHAQRYSTDVRCKSSASSYQPSSSSSEYARQVMTASQVAGVAYVGEDVDQEV